jgi:hypothetical protein
LIECLHRLVFFDAGCREAIEAGLHDASERFRDAGYLGAYSSITLPIGMFRDGLPEKFRDEIGLCRVFTIKAGQRAPHEEIHRNSIQRLVSFRGSGIINCAQPGGLDRTYQRYPVASPDQAQTPDISVCWDVVPENTWHFPQARGAGQWFGVAFHSASADSILDEYVPHAQAKDASA